MANLDSLSLADDGRLVIDLPSDTLDDDVELFASCLEDPSIWFSRKKPQGHLGRFAAEGNAGLFASVHLQPAAILDYVTSRYALSVPLTPYSLQRLLETSEGFQASEGEFAEADVDPRFWTILRTVISRSPLGDARTQSGWWNDTTREDRAKWNPLSDQEPRVNSTSAAGPAAKGAADVSRDASTHSQACLVARRRLRSGKHQEELLKCKVKDGRLLLAPVLPGEHVHHARAQPLDQPGPRTARPPSATSNDTDDHRSLVGKLSFNLAETPEQRDKREQLSMPYEPPNKGQGSIIFHPESDDDPDEEEDGDEDM